MTDLRQILTQTVREHYPDYTGPIELESKKDWTEFEYATPVAFALAKHYSRPAHEVAGELVAALHPKVAGKITVHTVPGAPSFINFTLLASAWDACITELLDRESPILSSQAGKRIIIEFMSANPTGPLTLANGRGGFSGDVLATILASAGAEVEREYYVNDTGNQIVELGKSIIAFRHGETIENGYKGDYIQELAERIESDDPFVAGRTAAHYILEEWIKPAIKRTGIHFDRYFSEQALVESNQPAFMLELLESEGLTYISEHALWLKTTHFGDDKDRVIRRSDGTFTYLLTDIAYHWDKLQRGYDTVITMVGGDHFTEAKVLDMVVRNVLAKTLRWVGEFRQPIYQMVRLMENGQEIKMSKRAGTYVTLDELLEMVPVDVVRFFFVWHAYSNHMDFDLNLARDTSDKNPVYYIQYAYVRAKHILAQADTEGFALGESCNLSPEERKLLLHIMDFPQCIETIVATSEPHYIAHYAIELARLFHAFYTACPVLKAEGLLRGQRVALTKITYKTLQQILSLMGISQPERMEAAPTQ